LRRIGHRLTKSLALLQKSLKTMSFRLLIGSKCTWYASDNLVSQLSQFCHTMRISMLKKIALIFIAACATLAAVGYVMYLGNTAPVAPAISAAEASNPSKPFVVKLHAQWCAVCMITTSVWSQIEKEYSRRVNFLVLDFTDEQTTDRSRVEAERVGLGRIFEEAGSTGVVLVVDGRTKEVTASIGGSRDVAEYRAAINAALDRTR
jgi:thiol-disulfide isomerase/thioredoxin